MSNLTEEQLRNIEEKSEWVDAYQQLIELSDGTVYRLGVKNKNEDYKINGFTADVIIRLATFQDSVHKNDFDDFIDELSKLERKYINKKNKQDSKD